MISAVGECFQRFMAKDLRMPFLADRLLPEDEQYPVGGPRGSIICSDGKILWQYADGRIVPPSRWCLKKEDFRHLRRMVWKAMQDGRIVPTGRDQFDRNDNKIGPNMYTVTEQFIRPITKNAGNVSWALMRNPEGLEVDLFISHAWTEGFFEFVDQVLASWPRTAKHAYCCVFANPQNEDISALISDPKESPFAKALQNCVHTMVVPNKTTSIYTRLWCAYEAFLAYDLNKTIFMAWSPMDVALLKGNATFALCVLLASATTYLLDTLSIEEYIITTVWAFFAASEDVLVYVIVYCESCLAARTGVLQTLNFFRSYFLVGRILLAQFPLNIIPVGDRFIAFSFLSQVAMLPLVNHYLVKRHKVHKQLRLLQDGFSGSISDSKCSHPDDESNILREIGDRQRDVDDAINVLSVAGVSTNELREISHRGINVTGASDVIFGSAILSWGKFASVRINSLVSPPDGSYSICEQHMQVDETLCDLWYILSVLLFSFVFPLAWLIIASRQQTDRWAFSCRVTAYLLNVGAFFGHFLLPYISVSPPLFLLGFLTIIVSHLGPARLTRCGYFGVCLTKITVQKCRSSGSNTWRTDCCYVAIVACLLCYYWFDDFAALLFFEVPKEKLPKFIVSYIRNRF